MTTRYWYAGTEITGVRLDPEYRASLPALAQVGEAAVGGVLVDDEAGTLDFAEWRRFRVTEDDLPAGGPPDSNGVGGTFQRIWTGFTADIEVERGDMLTAAGRVWHLTLIEENALLRFRVVEPGQGGSRPAETDLERLAWWLRTPYVDGQWFTDLGLIDWTNPVALDAHDYTGQYLGEVLADMSNQSGKNHFLVFHPTSADVHWDIFYARNDSELFTSSLRISNVAADIDSATVFAPSQKSKWKSEAARIYSHIYMPYDGGSVFRSRALGAGEVTRHGIAPAADVKTAAKANTLADRELTECRDPDEEITTELWLPAARIADIKPGHRLQVKFSHLPGYESYRWTRIVEHDIAQDRPGQTDDFYRVRIRLTPAAAAVTAPTCADNAPVTITPGTYAYATHGSVYVVGPNVVLPNPITCNAEARLVSFNFSTTDPSKSMHISLTDTSGTFLTDFWSQLDNTDGPFPRTITVSVTAASIAAFAGMTVRFMAGVPIATASEITWSVAAGSGLYFIN